MLDHQKINAKCGTNYTAAQVSKAIDCPVSIKGIADRIMTDHAGSIRFDTMHKAFFIYAHGEWRKIEDIVIRSLIRSEIDNLQKEIRILTNAQIAGILPNFDPTPSIKKILTFQQNADDALRNKIFEALRIRSASMRVRGVSNEISDQVYDATR
ncbi:hypothetical protein GQF56_07190 [Rhodobacter sphaeroides]|jgi:hypothetical protein|uniref:Uncharacterized protein n=1 Tax=Cereibacter sphaeroides (strain ATCC 17023 / DSM 158 / JCM 6121 / CCUG 31486 / LMG 2827 / NBRC 12203 / NCIMB 8253 / ATH 2.4.1.) TaxID=272943 RepID=U5NMC4_CERS4|nr:hypothetical protein [Cereibacter sphaeroides]AGY32417.1 hypothetical protein RSP_7541 [Cereibacter sphaeroides 2.4.1]AXC61380.1 hypothetical protein DQL45_08395 [Cereibacter sphaeroides 2.4.1]MVX47656.1 hypothetical protein [Cereibacter sphaeroides]QHA10973.1 hypothetical protein GQR99_08395 [Cereibacter sphaeroides]QHA13462.1 hypothetical protein GQY06_08375 [Cereibacter sphaeroides]